MVTTGAGARTPAPTLESVAARAGVSRATAGRVLSGSTTVRESTRQGVRHAAVELGYVTNYAARRALGIRVTQCGRPYVPDPELAFVDADNVGGARLATRYPLDLRRVLVVIDGPADMTAAQDRLRGFHHEFDDRSGATVGDRWCTVTSPSTVAGPR